MKINMKKAINQGILMGSLTACACSVVRAVHDVREWRKARKQRIETEEKLKATKDELIERQSARIEELEKKLDETERERCKYMLENMHMKCAESDRRSKELAKMAETLMAACEEVNQLTQPQKEDGAPE
ncbi:MAG: hypothetical protein J6U28_08645 [Bacteroidales bacterium]|nr:hypothetical protein [Bacteroidales bacterium]